MGPPGSAAARRLFGHVRGTIALSVASAFCLVHGYPPPMSYDLAVWVGERPASDAVAGQEYERRAEAVDAFTDVELAAAVPEIQAFLDEVLTRFPGLGEPGDEDSPWAVGPEPGDVNGDFAYLNMTYPGARACLEAVVEIAHRYGLVCFDPQSEKVL